MGSSKCVSLRGSADNCADLGLPGYFDLVARAVSLSTIRRKLDECRYAEPRDFEREARLLVQNAQTYHQPGSIEFEAADAVKDIFEREFAKLSFGEGGAGKAGAAKKRGAKRGRR